MKEKPNLGRVINVPGKSQLWETINRIVFKLLLAHFLLGDREWKTNAIHQLKEVLKNRGEIPDFSNYEELSGSKQAALNAEGSFCWLMDCLWGDWHNYVTFEHTYVRGLHWHDVNGNFIDKYAEKFAVRDVYYDDVVPAIHKWIKEVETSDPKWMDSKDGFSYPIFNWHEERQTTVFASVKWRLPNLQ